MVYASPLDRALETAAIVSTELGLAESIVHDDLIERNFGIMTGRPAADVEEMCAPDIIKTENVTYFLRPDGAETFPDLLARGRGCLILWRIDTLIKRCYWYVMVISAK